MERDSHQATTLPGPVRAASPPLGSHSAALQRPTNAFDGLPLPPAAWMWKPRSKLYDSHHQAKISKSVFSFRRVGAKDWHRRYVFVEGDEICYGKGERQRDRVVFFGTVRGGGVEGEGAMLRERAPKELARFGWFLQTEAKRVLFACENEGVWQAWVGFVSALVARLATIRSAPPPTQERLRQRPPTSTQEHSAHPTPPQGTHSPAPPRSPLSAEKMPVPRSAAPATPQEDEATNFVDATLNWSHSPGQADLSLAATSSPSSTGAADAATEMPTDPPPRQDDGPSHLSDDEENGGQPTGRAQQHHVSQPRAAPTRPESNDDSVSRSGSESDSGDEDELSSSITSDDEDSDTEEELSDDDSTASGARDAAEEAAQTERCERLRALARTPHPHSAGRLPSLAPHFASNDNTTNVVFCAVVDKVARGDSLQPRDLVVTGKYLYLFSKRKFGGGTKSRVIAVGDITGVLESTTTPSLLAILVPSFHDVLIKLPPSPPSVKEELIAHLFVLHAAASSGRRFRFERGSDIGGAIRRKEDDRYDPLASRPGDLMQAATRPALFPVLRITGDTVVLWSSIVREVRAGRPPQLSALLITDGAFYLLSDTLAKKGRRTALCDVTAVLYERDAQSVLIQCGRRAVDENGLGQGDALFSVQRGSDFTGILRAMRRAAKMGYERKVKVSASRQLYSQAQLARSERKAGAANKGGGRVAGAGAGIPDGGGRSGLVPLGTDDEPRRRQQRLKDRLRSAWRAGVRQETKYMARLRTHGGGAGKEARQRGSTGSDSSSATDRDDGDDVVAAALAGANASFVFDPRQGLSNYMMMMMSDPKGGGDGGGEGEEGNDGDGASTEASSPASDSASAAGGTDIRFQSQFRFVEELIRDYDDVVQLLAAARRDLPGAVARWDALRLAGTTFAASAAPRAPSLTQQQQQQQQQQPPYVVGKVLCSAPCQRLSTKAIATLAKMAAGSGHDGTYEALFQRFGEARVVCLATEGIFVLFRVAQGQRLALSHKRKAGDAVGSRGDNTQVELFVSWAEVDALVRCHHNTGAVVGIMTKGSQIHDIALNLATKEAMASFEEAAATCYEEYGRKHPPRASGHDESDARADTIPPLFAAPRPENVAKALRKSEYDPFPTVALRYSPHSAGSDRLRLAVVPDVAEPCRRFGDNTIHFSGVAWRFRSQTLRKMGGVVDADPEAAMNRRNNHLYKSFILIVTNVAIYHCTKGGYESVRRTELTKLRAVCVSEKDPDTVLLMIPSEYDMYFRVAGRGKELVARLQEAYVEWTDYGLYRPGEAVGSHRASDYFVPVRYASPIGPLGTLTKPDEFNYIQASRSAAECRGMTEQWHLRYLQAALDGFRAAVQFASSPAPRLPRWAVAKARLATSQSSLYFAHRRAFRFGLRAGTFTDMAAAQQLLERFKGMQAAAAGLADAVAATDPIGYGAAVEKASAFSELAPLVSEQSVRYKRFVDMRDCLDAILEVVDSSSSAEGPAPSQEGSAAAQQEKELDTLFATARDMGFDEGILWDLRRYQIVRRQRDALAEWLSKEGGEGRDSMREGRGNAAAASLIRAAAWELGLPLPPHPSKAEAATMSEGETSDNDGDDAAAQFEEMASTLKQIIGGGSRLGVTALQQGCGRARRLLHQNDASKLSASASERVQAARGELEAQLQQAEHAIEVLGVHEASRRELAELTRVVNAHRAANDWDGDNVKELLAWCQRLLHALPSDEMVLAGERDVLLLHQETLQDHQHRLALSASFLRQEAAAQQAYEVDLLASEESARRSEAAKQRRERAQRARRQAGLLSAWTDHATGLCARLRTALGEGVDEPVRYAVKQCVLFQRVIAEGVKAQLTTTTGEGAEAAESRKRLREGGDRLRAQLHAAAERGHDFLTRKDSAGAKGDAAAGGDGDAGSTRDQTLPEELARILDQHDSAALIQYVEEHEEELTAHRIAEVRTRWAAVAQRAAWERQVHRAIDCARTLNSRPLLQQAVDLAATKGFSDDAVEQARATLARAVGDTLDHLSEDEGGGAGADSDASLVLASEEDEPAARQDDNNVTRGASPAVVVGGSSSSGEIVLGSTDASLSGAVSPAEMSDSELADSSIPTPPQPSPTQEAAREAGPPATPTAVDPSRVEALLALLPSPVSSSPDKANATRGPRLAQLLSDSLRCVLQHDPPLLTMGGAAEAEAVAAADRLGSRLPVVTDSTEARSVLVAWVGVFSDGLKPSGFFTKTPRTVHDVLGYLGDYSDNNGDFIAPYTNRVVSIVDREMGRRSTAPAAPSAGTTPEQEEMQARVVAFAFVAAMVRERHLEAVVREVTAAGPKVRGEVLLPDATLNQPELLKDLLLMANVTDALSWPPWSFHPGGEDGERNTVSSPQAAPPPPPPPPQRHAEQGSPANASRAAATTTTTTTAASWGRLSPSAATELAGQRPSPSRGSAGPSVASRAGDGATPAAAVKSAGSQTPPAATAVATAGTTRDQLAMRCSVLLREAVLAVSAYFTAEVAATPRATNGVPAAGAALAGMFDEALHPRVIAVVAQAVLPAIVSLLEAGLARRYHVFRTRTVWDALVAFKEHLQTSSRQLAGAEVVSVLELVEVLADAERGGRYASRLEKMPEEQLHKLRVRLFLRECLNRQVLYGFFTTFFPASGEDGVWNCLDGKRLGESDEGLWRFYDPRLCVMLPRNGDDDATEQLWSILHRIASLPFVVATDRELR